MHRHDPTVPKTKRQKQMGRKNPFYLPIDPEKDNCVVFDVDGTLALSDHRSPYDTSLAHLDPIHEPIREMAHSLPHFFDLVVVSGREFTPEAVTEKWLKTTGANFKFVFQRQPFDVDAKGKKLNDAVVKARIFREHIQPRYNVKWVFDDRNRVVDMWRAAGVCVLQCQDGNF